jgi:hypothetical protein
VNEASENRIEPKAIAWDENSSMSAEMHTIHHSPIKCPSNSTEQHKCLENVLNHQTRPIVVYVSIADGLGKWDVQTSASNKHGITERKGNCVF